VGFQNLAGRDLSLRPRTKYKGAATDRTDPGANLDDVKQAFSRYMSAAGPFTAATR
jgi:hypothetical protein